MLSGCGAGEPVAVPDVVGMQADQARNILEDAGFDVELDTDAWVLMESNWTVDTQSPKAGTKAPDGSTVAVKVSKRVEAEQPEEPEPTEETESETPPTDPVDTSDETASGLSFPYAMTTCDQVGLDASTYGWNADFLMDGTHQMQGDAWFLQAGVTITNEYGTEGRYTVDCLVGGSDETPVVVSFNVY